LLLASVLRFDASSVFLWGLTTAYNPIFKPPIHIYILASKTAGMNPVLYHFFRKERFSRSIIH